MSLKDEPPATQSANSLAPGNLPQRLGRYRLTSEIARGGAAIVFRGRDEALHRDVAIKILHAGPLASREAVRRLFLEARATARLHHPNILPIYEVGGAESQPFIAMPLLEGGTLASRILDGQFMSASPQEIARLLRKIALAVHHAHRRGILHRDLKPGNILFDSASEPLVGDFGLVRVLEEDSTITLSQAVLGTPAYMSPEQARGDGAELTVAADIYALGAILYELLAGAPPFTGASVAEVLRKLEEEEPAAPLARKPDSRNSSSSFVPRPSSLDRDLQTICLKCLEKEPAKRYATAQDLADDLERFLNDEPILARPVTRIERVGRWCRRKPALATSLVLILILFLIVIIGSPIAAYRINEARRQAAEQASVASAMNEFLTEDLLRQADVWKAEAHASPNRDVRLLEIVNRASAGVDAKFAGQPLVAAKIHMTVGSVYAGLGEIEKAEHHLRTAKRLFEAQVGLNDPRALEASHALAVLLRVNRAAFDEAESLIRHVLHVRQSALGTAHRDTLSAMLELAELRGAHNDHGTAAAMFAEATRHATLALGADDPLTLRGREAEIETIRGRGEWHAAKRLQQELWETRKRVQGESHPDTLNTLWNLAWFTMRAEADYPRVAQLIDEGLKLSRPVLGEHGATHDLEATRSTLLQYQGFIKASRELREQRLAVAERVYGPSHPAAIGSRRYVAYHHGDLGTRHLETLSTFEDCLQAERRLGPDSRGAQINRNWLASVYWHVGQTEDCLAIWQENLEIRQRLYGTKSPSALQAIQSLGDLYARLGDWAAASAFLGEFAQSEFATARDLAKAALARALSNPAMLQNEWAPPNWEQVVASADSTDATHLLTTLLLTSIGDGFAHRRVKPGPHGQPGNSAHLADLIQAVVRRVNDDIAAVDGHLLIGLTEIGNEHWNNAIEQLEPVIHGAPEPEARILASYLASIALVHQGFATEAQRAFENAEDTLRRLVAAGELGHRWGQLALGLVARNQAAGFLPTLGQPEAIDAAYLTNARERWKPVQAALHHSFALARSGQWTGAVTALQQAMAMDDFAWEAAELSVYRWSFKVALILASAQDSLTSQIRQEFHPFNPKLLSPDATAVSLFPIRTMGDSSESFWVDSRRFASRLLEVSLPKAPGWRPLLKALMLLQHNQPREALAELVKAEASYNLHCAGVASAYRAQANFHLQDPAQAHAALERAEEILLRLQENDGEDLGEVWVEQRLCELAVEEARRMAQ